MTTIPLLILVVGITVRLFARLVHDTAIYVLGSVIMIVGLVICSVLAAFTLNIVIAAVGFFSR